jgi:hypothetical protein
MTERYAKLGKAHMARTGNTAREIWKLMIHNGKEETPDVHQVDAIWTSA